MIKQFIADAFTDKIFHGNPAAICLPERWPDDKLMQDIASENNGFCGEGRQRLET